MVLEDGERKSTIFIANKAKEELSVVTGLKSSSVIGVEKDSEDWRVTLEMVEKNSIPDSMDILGIYEVHLDSEGCLKSFNRTSLRKRGNLSETIYTL